MVLILDLSLVPLHADLDGERVPVSHIPLQDCLDAGWPAVFGSCGVTELICVRIWTHLKTLLQYHPGSSTDFNEFDFLFFLIEISLFYSGVFPLANICVECCVTEIVQ